MANPYLKEITLDAVKRAYRAENTNYRVKAKFFGSSVAEHIGIDYWSLTIKEQKGIDKKVAGMLRNNDCFESQGRGYYHLPTQEELNVRILREAKRLGDLQATEEALSTLGLDPDQAGRGGGAYLTVDQLVGLAMVFDSLKKD